MAYQKRTEIWPRMIMDFMERKTCNNQDKQVAKLLAEFGGLSTSPVTASQSVSKTTVTKLSISASLALQSEILGAQGVQSTEVLQIPLWHLK
ncbi:MAG TPA: hypothetical protein VG077_19630 [Verrucomicrobiae bacterium]|nr:hypothetical protein [Verrucomicrobiae bacterium]